MFLEPLAQLALVEVLELQAKLTQVVQVLLEVLVLKDHKVLMVPKAQQQQLNLLLVPLDLKEFKVLLDLKVLLVIVLLILNLIMLVLMLLLVLLMVEIVIVFNGMVVDYQLFCLMKT